jgi:hypothetical protein
MRLSKRYRSRRTDLLGSQVFKPWSPLYCRSNTIFLIGNHEQHSYWREPAPCSCLQLPYNDMHLHRCILACFTLS